MRGTDRVKVMKDAFAIAEFFVEGKQQKKTHVLLHISEPTLGEHTKGYFFAICQLQRPQREDIVVLQELIDDVERGYYESSDHDAFEKTLQYLNQRSENFRTHAKSIACFLGVIQGSQITYSVKGQPVGEVLYRKKGQWKNISLTRNVDQEKELLFSSVTQGTLAKNDVVFIGTPGLRQLISIDRIQSLLEKQTIEGTVRQIQKFLLSQKIDETHGGLLLHSLSEEVLPKTGKVPKREGTGSKASIDQMVQSQVATAKTLSPPVIPGVKRGLQTMFAHESTHPPKNNVPRARNTAQKEEWLLVLGKAIVMGIVGLLTLLKQLVLLLWRGIKMVVLFATNHGNQRDHIIGLWQDSFRRNTTRIRRLPFLSKVLLVIALILCITFASSLLFSRMQQQKIQESAHYEATIAAIVDKKNAAQASKIYKNDEKAFTLLKEAMLMIEKLEDGPKEWQEQAAVLRAEVEDSLNEFRNIQKVTPTIIASLPEEVTVGGLISLGDVLLAYQQDSGTVYEIDGLTGEFNPIEQQAASEFQTAAATDDNIILISSSGNGAQYSPTTHAIGTRDIRGASERVADAMEYGDRLYVLTQDGAIFSHSAIQTGYDRPQPWLKDNVSIANPRAITIDGNIYVLTQSSVEKYRRGESMPFSLAGLDPELNNPTELLTQGEGDPLYVLDPQNNRIVVLEKDGSLRMQLMADEWTNLKGMSIDPNRNRLYVVSGNSVSYIRI